MNEINKILPTYVKSIRIRQKIFEIISPHLDNVIHKFLISLSRNEEVKTFLTESNIPRLIRKLKEFVKFILTKEINEDYIKEVEKIAHIHFRIGLKDYHLHFGINLFLSLIYEIFQKTDPFLFPYFMQLLLFIEYIILKAYCKNREKTFLYDFKGKQIFDIINELYLAFKWHEKAKKILEQFWFFKDKKKFLQYLKENKVPLSPEECYILKRIKELKNSPFKDLISINFDYLEKLLYEWFENLQNLIKAIENEENEKIKLYYNNLLKISRQIFEILGNPLQELGSMIFLLVYSGIKLLYLVTDLIYKHDFFLNQKNVLEVLKNKLKEILEKTLAWAILEIDFLEDKNISKRDYDIFTKIEFSGKAFYIGIKLRDLPYKEYIKELINILLEICKLVTFLQNREHELRELANKAAAANRAKDMFLANMSHELRTPLNAIIGFAQLLQLQPNLPENLKPFAQKIQIAGENLLELVNAILDFTKLEMGKIDFKPEKFDISNLFKEVEEIIKPLLERKKLHFYYPKNISLNLYADPKLLKEVFLNLLSNAIKFTPENGKVWIEIDFSKKDNAYVFKVCDNGIGIKKEDIPKLFKPFVQLDNPLHKKFKGTGLGLAIVKKIIDLHKGKVWIESEEGKGTKVCFTIPISQENKISFSESRALKENAPTILILEDSETYVSFLKNCLKQDFNIISTNSVKKGIEIIKNSKVDLILLDYFLSDGVGKDILEILKEEKKNIPVILLSAEIKVENLLSEEEKKLVVKTLSKLELSCKELKEIILEVLKEES